MPALPAVANVIRVAFKFTDGADVNVESRYFLKYSGTAPTATQLNTFAQAAFTSLGTRMAPSMATAITLVECIVIDLSSGGASGSYSGSTAGTDSGTYLPAGTCCLVNYGVSRRYRGGKPRGYWPFGSTAQQATPQTWSSTFVTNTGANLSAHITDVIGDAWSGATITGQVNVSYYEGFTPFTTPSGRVKNLSKLRVSGPITDAIISIVCNPKFGSQRRRNLHST